MDLGSKVKRLDEGGQMVPVDEGNFGNETFPYGRDSDTLDERGRLAYGPRTT
ncbi:hypothetical protein PAXINDRAFT_168542 [Paxillus involutus ATCC 200175]|nr:hypothetical protein PAXINDRAFT_168542 [Paxillus involutus ATCC 200175]